jgi:nucleoside-diphosphate-sugar epimerase
MIDLRCKYSSKLGVAITGSSGFTGTRLRYLFGADDFLTVAYEDIKESSVIIHLAANVLPTREAMLENITIDTYVLEIANRKHKGLIYASGNNVYPFSVDCRTSDSTRCNDYYSASKIVGERLITELANLPFTVIRIADVFGIGQRHGNFFKAIENSVLNRKPLKQYGAGQKRRTYIHIDELCEIIKFLTFKHKENQQQSSILNLGYSDSASISEIINLVSNMTGLKIEMNSIESDNSHFDIRTMKVSQLHGYTPCWASFSEALHGYIYQIKSTNQKELK